MIAFRAMFNGLGPLFYLPLAVWVNPINPLSPLNPKPPLQLRQGERNIRRAESRFMAGGVASQDPSLCPAALEPDANDGGGYLWGV